MGEPARQLGDDDLNPYNRGSTKSARERADEAWGTAPNEDELRERESQEDNPGGDAAESEEQKSARQRANEAWGMGGGASGLFKGGEDTGGVSSRRKKAGLWAGGGVAVMLVVALIFIFLGTLKIPHFSQILVGAGYSRLNSLIRERATQNLYDIAVTDGPGTVNPPKTTLWDRMRGRDPVKDIAQLGKEGRFKFVTTNDKTAFSLRKKGMFQGIDIEGKSVRLDTITKNLGFGNSYYKLVDPRKQWAVRAEFTKQLQNAIGDGLELDGRHIRSKTFIDSVAGNIDFKFSRWRNKGREYFGKTPKEAYIQNMVESAERVNRAAVVTGVGTIDKTTGEVQLPDNIRKYLEKNNATMDREAYIREIYARNVTTAQKVADAASNVGQITLLLTLACTTNLAFSHIDEMNANSYKQAEHEGLLLAAAGSQSRWPAETVSEAVNAESSRLDGAETAPSYQVLTGGTFSGTPSNVETPRVRSQISPAFAQAVQNMTSPTRLGLGGQLIQFLPGLGGILDNIDQKFCEALLSPEGLIIGVGAEIVADAVIAFFTFGGGAVAAEGGAAAATRLFVTQLSKAVLRTGKGLLSPKSLATVGAFGLYSYGIELVIGWLSSTNFSGTEVGANQFENAAVGTDLRQSHDNRVLLRGRPVTEAETRELDVYGHNNLQTSYNEKGWRTRYLAIDNPYSVFGHVVGATPSTPGGMANLAQNSFSKIGSMFTLSFATSALVGKASAADETYDRHSDIIQWDYTMAERNKMRTEPEFGLQAVEAYVQPRLASLDAKYGKCYTTQDQYEADKLFLSGECSVALLSTDEALKYRIFTGLDKHVTDDVMEPLLPPAVGTNESASNIKYAFYNGPLQSPDTDKNIADKAPMLPNIGQLFQPINTTRMWWFNSLARGM